MKYLIVYEIDSELLNGPEKNNYLKIYVELEDFMIFKNAAKITNNVWAIKPRSSRTSAKFIRNHLFNTVLKKFHNDQKKHLRLFVTPINEQNYATKNPICDSQQNVRGILEWFINS